MYEYKTENAFFDEVVLVANKEQLSGWELVSTFNRGNFVTLVFRRPKK